MQKMGQEADYHFFLFKSDSRLIKSYAHMLLQKEKKKAINTQSHTQIKYILTKISIQLEAQCVRFGGFV